MEKIYLPALLTLACGSALATPGNSKLEETVVTSSRVPVPLRQVGASISVITGQDILERGYVSLADVLRWEPSVSVSNNGGAGKATSLRIRGENGFRTKVLLDGIDITDTSSPQSGPRFEQLTSAGTERVEVLRGPQGMMYGADAGGVVTISTKRPEPGFGGGVSAEFGSYGAQQYGGHLGAGSDKVDISLSGSRFDNDGFNSSTTDTVLRDDDGYRNTSFHARAGWTISDTLRAELVGHQVDGNNQYDDCFTADTFAPTNACRDNFDQNAWRAALSQQGTILSHQLAYGSNQIDRKFYSQGQRSFAAKSELNKLEYLGSWNHSAGLKLVYGLDLQNESIDDGSFDVDRDQTGYYLEYRGEVLDNIFLTAGARYDDNDDFGSETTYRVGAVYALAITAGEFKFKGSYGSGFRAPSLYEISYNGGPFAYPPAAGTDLEAEKSEGYDLGVAYYAHSGWLVEAIYFDQRVNDEIVFDLVDFSGYLQGTGDSTSKGVEFIAELPLADTLALTGNYTYNDTEDADGLQRLRVPEHMANLGLSFRPWEGRLVLGLHLRLTRDVADEFNGDIDDYEIIDFNASYRIAENLEVYGRVENVTDEEYVEVPTYNSSGAAAYAGLRYSF